MIEPFRHNSWATLRLLEFCRNLDPALLDATAPGTFGPIKETLAHLIGGDELLVAMAEGATQTGPPPRFTSLDDLLERARWLAERWERCLEPEPHPERLVERDEAGVRRLVRVGTVLAEAVYHGNHHRSQVCSALRTIDVAPPPLDGWTYGAWVAERTDRHRRRDDVL
jgi:uncharacterized damage-inducible protein DinB